MLQKQFVWFQFQRNEVVWKADQVICLQSFFQILSGEKVKAMVWSESWFSELQFPCLHLVFVLWMCLLFSNHAIL